MTRHQRAALAYALEIGADEVRIVLPRRGHPQLRFRFDGRACVVVLSGTPSDRKADCTMRRDVRHAAGIASRQPVQGERRQRGSRNAAADVPLTQCAAPPTDWRDALRSHPLAALDATETVFRLPWPALLEDAP